jgi:hypothetical protein
MLWSVANQALTTYRKKSSTTRSASCGFPTPSLMSAGGTSSPTPASPPVVSTTP